MLKTVSIVRTVRIVLTATITSVECVFYFVLQLSVCNLNSIESPVPEFYKL